LSSSSFVGVPPEKTFKSNVNAQTGAPESKLTSWIQQRAQAIAPETPEAVKLKGLLEKENTKLKKAIKDGKDIAPLEEKIKELSDKLSAEKRLASSAQVQSLTDRLNVLGYTDSDFAGTTKIQRGLNTAKGMGRRGRLNTAGRTTAGRLGRAGALATAALSPEIASYVGDLISSGENE
jgi:hypothetical protein